MKMPNITCLLILMLLQQGCGLFTSEQEKRINKVEYLLQSGCDPEDNYDLSFDGIGNGSYLLEVETATKDIEVLIAASVFAKSAKQANAFAEHQLRRVQDKNFRHCFKMQLPIILDILRTAEQRMTKCIQDRSASFIGEYEFKTQDLAAIADRADFSGGHVKKQIEICYPGILHHDIIEVYFQRTSCIDGRCDIGDIITDLDQTTDTASACVLIKSWSANEPFGAGGKVSGYLYGKVQRTLREDKKQEYIHLCSRRYPTLAN